VTVHPSNGILQQAPTALLAALEHTMQQSTEPPDR
jgi:hypothetical protein